MAAMRALPIIFWIAVAVLEIYRRVAPAALTWAGPVLPWMVLVISVLPLVTAVREVRAGHLIDGMRSGLWVIPGLVTLLWGPAWMRLPF
jgi:hypothetical protein